jgi:hypothetical protein
MGDVVRPNMGAGFDRTGSDILDLPGSTVTLINGGHLTSLWNYSIEGGATTSLSSGTLTAGHNSWLGPTMTVGYWGNGTPAVFNMSGGLLETLTEGMSVGTLGEAGTWNMSGGTANIAKELIFSDYVPAVPEWGKTGILNMTGGQINVAGDLLIATEAGSYPSQIWLQGGTLSANSFEMGAGSSFDIALGGTLRIAGDQRLAPWLNDLTYSITKGDGLGIRSVVYDGSSTAITSIPEPTTLVLCAFGGLAMLRGHVRRRTVIRLLEG